MSVAVVGVGVEGDRADGEDGPEGSGGWGGNGGGVGVAVRSIVDTQGRELDGG